MTIKKPAKEGGAAIADRFRLNTPAEGPKASASDEGGIATKIAVACGVIALIVAGALTYTLWTHWEFLQNA